MEIKSTVIQCLKHSDFIAALSMPDIFDFNCESRKGTHSYDKVRIQSRITLNDVSLIEGKPLKLYGSYITTEEKNGCGSDLFFDVPNSSTSISVRGEFETTVNITDDIIDMVTEFGGSGYQYGANRDNRRIHDPLYSKINLNGSLLDVYGQVTEVFKIVGEKCTHSSSICDNVSTFKIEQSKDQTFVRDFSEVYPNGIISRDLLLENRLDFNEKKDMRMQRDGDYPVPTGYDSTDAYYFTNGNSPKKEKYAKQREKRKQKTPAFHKPHDKDKQKKNKK